MSETKVECTVCGKLESVNFGHCLRSGWPKCCGYTMRMTSTETSVREATKAAIGEQIMSVPKRRFVHCVGRVADEKAS